MKKNNPSILITGGCGLIGSNFVKKILNKKFHLIIIDDLSYGHSENLEKIFYFSKKKKKNIKFFKVNLINKQKLKTIFINNKIEYIFHFAAFSNVEMSIRNPNKIIKNNVESTKNLIFFAKKYNVKNFIFSSSASVYGNVNFDRNIKELDNTKPINPYGKSKLICEKIITNKSNAKTFNYCIFRYFNVVGKHLSKKIKKNNNLSLFEKINFCVREKKIFKIHGGDLNTKDGTPVRDYIHLEDLVTAHEICLTNKSKKFWNNIYNIGYNKGVSVLQVILACKKIFKKKLKFKYIEKKRGIIQKSIANNSKFIRATNWKPKYSKIEKMINSYFVKT